MKLFGNSIKARHSKKSMGKRIITALIVLAIICGGGYAFLKIYVRPPEIVVNTPVEQTSDTPDDTQTQQIDEKSPTGRVAGKYTFLLLGVDKVSGNTDTIMIGTFDVNEHTVNVVSIPRDTLVNVSWSTKKANTLYGGNIDDAKEGFADIIGYKPDFYAVVNLDAFVHVVDSVGGVWYDVPDIDGNGQGMNYEDPTQDLSIHLKPGYQLLTGTQAIGIVRYRKGYKDADIGRISSQQKFLTAAMQQILDNKLKINIADIISIFLKYVKTDLDYGECAWFAKELLKLNMDNVHFYTMPGKYNDYVLGKSYVTITVDEWIEMINTTINPFDKPIKEENLNILTRDPKTNKIYSTTGKYADSESWGN